MIESEKPNPLQPERIPEGAAETEVVLFLSRHIDAPCSVEVAPGVVENIRGFYIREAKRFMETMTNENAKHLLELKIAEYEESSPS